MDIDPYKQWASSRASVGAAGCDAALRCEGRAVALLVLERDVSRLGPTPDDVRRVVVLSEEMRLGIEVELLPLTVRGKRGRETALETPLTDLSPIDVIAKEKRREHHVVPDGVAREVRLV